jgi:hypothetical protein
VKTPEFFHMKLNEFNKQKQAVAKITTVTLKPLFASFKLVYRIDRSKKTIFNQKKFIVTCCC